MEIEDRPKKHRSPSVPFISLREAVERARTLFEAERRNASRPDVVVERWGYSRKSSGANQILAALRAFGLLEDGGEGLVRLTERAVHILLENEGSEKQVGLLRQAALAPPLHAELWSRYNANLPADKILSSYLISDHRFNPGSVHDFIRCYKETLAFAGLRQPPASPAEPALPLPPPSSIPSLSSLPPSDLTLRFPLRNDNWGELRVLRKIAPQEKDQIRALFEFWLEKISGA